MKTEKHNCMKGKITKKKYLEINDIVPHSPIPKMISESSKKKYVNPQIQLKWSLSYYGANITFMAIDL